jgi:uncharacterized protein YcnI
VGLEVLPLRQDLHGPWCLTEFSEIIMSVVSRLFFLVLLALAGSAHAHITLEYQTAHAGSRYKANFKVPHGCGDSPIREIVVQIPPGVHGVKPMPKPGWTVRIERAPLVEPYMDHGRRVSEAVVRVSWAARSEADPLPSDHYDEFALHAVLPNRPGPVYWPVSQVCVQGRIDWHEQPRTGQSPRQLKTPAAVLELIAADADHVH